MYILRRYIYSDAARCLFSHASLTISRLRASSSLSFVSVSFVLASAFSAATDTRRRNASVMYLARNLNPSGRVVIATMFLHLSFRSTCVRARIPASRARSSGPNPHF